MMKSTEMFFALLRLSMDEGRSGDLSMFENANKTDWEQLFALAVRQGSVLLTYGGLQHLPAESQPPRKLKLRWVANVLKGSERYDRYKITIKNLSNLLSKNDIDLLVVKGVTISELYPIPHYREGGDIDAYLFGKETEANKLMVSMGVEVNDTIPKHSAFMYNGLVVENHRTFFDTDLPFKRESKLYQDMENMLMGMFSKENAPLINIGTARMLPPQAAALFMIGHAFRHFCCLDINVRQLCDWTMFFDKCDDKIDKELLARQLKELGLVSFVEHMNSFCAKHLGFTPSFCVAEKEDLKAESKILKMILKYRVAPKLHVPVVGVVRFLRQRNRVYKRYLGRIKASEFLIPELKSYFSYILKRKK